MTGLQTLIGNACQEVGAFRADIVYLYTDFRYFGRYLSEFESRDGFCGAFALPFLEREKTVVLTTFTYTTEGRFDVLKTPTTTGAMNKWILTQPGASRSEHPLFSYAALGPQARLMENVGKSAFGRDSINDRLRGRRAAFLHIGRPVALGNSAIHYIEQACGATYRVHKAFHTAVYRGDNYIGTDYTAFVRRRDVPNETFAFDFSRAAPILFERGLISQVGSPEQLSNVSFYWFDDALECLADSFYKDPRLFIGSDFLQY